MRTSKERRREAEFRMDAGDKKFYFGVALFFGGAALYLLHARCTKACPGAVNEMIRMEGVNWRYSNLADVFDQFGGCKSCVEYAKSKFPEILESAPQQGESNAMALNDALSKHGIST
jgi:hypothetical protein